MSILGMASLFRIAKHVFLTLLAFICIAVFQKTALAGEFTTAVTYTTGTTSKGACIGDFNGDKIPDLAVANFGSNTVSVLLGNGDGTFQSAVNYAVGMTPSSCTAADFNGDGKLDLAVANTNNFMPGGNVSILLGNGDGTFQSAVNYAGTIPVGVFASDLNKDGKLDLVVDNHSGKIGILIGNGDGTFQNEVLYAAGGNPLWVALGDYNGDGKTDLAVANKVTNNVSILLGNGNGTFQTAVNYGAGTGPVRVETGDLNGDGKLDLAVANGGSNDVSLLFGNGDGTFQTAISVGTARSPASVAIADFNGDKKLDLITATPTGNNVNVFLGNGDGTFQALVSYGAGSSPQYVAIGDLNGDNAPDLAVANGPGGVSVLLNTGGTFLNTTSSANPSNFGQAVTFTTTVTASISGSPTGSVNFLDGSTLLGSSGISGGQSSFVTSSLSIGTHTINAQYSGDSNFNPNSAPPLTQTVNGGSPMVVLNPTSLTFPVQTVGTTSAAKTITLTNTGTGTLTITSLVASGDFQQTNTCGTSVAAGGSCTISVTFTPTAGGMRSGSVTVTDNAPNSPQTAALSGIGTVIKLSSKNANFGNVTVGTTSPPKTLTITNVGTFTVTFTSFTITGTNAGDFALPSNTCGTSLAAGKSCKVMVTFTPSATGARSATLNVNDNGGGSPQKVALSGTGV